MAPSADKEKNLLKASGLIELASREGARIICLPQLFNTRWFPATIDKKALALAEEGEKGAAVSCLREAAAKFNAILIVPIFEKDGADYFSTAFCIGARGEVIGKYRKMHVPGIPLWEEKAYFKPGNLGFPVFKTDYATIGIQLCWDVFFPEGFRILALNGAEVIFTPTASAFYHSRGKWERAIRAAAHANGVFIFRANRVGKEERQEFYGRSFCCGPDGEYAASPSGPSEGIVMADMDLGEVARTRNEWVFLKDRRPEEYKDISEAKREGRR